MTKLQAQRNFVLDNRLLYGFTHNTKETIQAIRYMRGETSLPEGAWPFISSEPLRESNPATAQPADSRYVVEISSTKVLELDGKYLQLVRFKEALNFCPELLKIFFDHASREALAKRRAALQEAPSFSHVPEHVQHALTHTVMHVQNAQEILDDLKTIQQLLGGTFVLVTHCNAINAEGQPIADRAQMVETVKLAASTLGIPAIEPGALLAHFGQSRGMPDEGRDTAHYTPAFAKLVGRAICEKLLGTADQNPVASTEPLDWKQCIERAKASARELEWDNALLLTNRAIELKNGSPTAYVLRARAVTALDQTDDILDAWSIALSIDSNRSAYILRQAAEGAMEVGEYDKARDWAAESLDKESDEKTALLLGRIHSKLGQNAQAEQAFRKYAAGDAVRALRFASRAHTPLADAANMVNALASTPGVDQAGLDSARAAVLKRATREVKRTGRVGALLPTLSAFYALQSLPQDTQEDQDDQINQAYRRLLKAYETYPEYQNSTETVALLGRLAPLEATPGAGACARRHRMLAAPGRLRAAGRTRDRRAGRGETVAARRPPGRRARLCAVVAKRRHGPEHRARPYRQVPARAGPQLPQMPDGRAPAGRRGRPQWHPVDRSVLSGADLAAAFARGCAQARVPGAPLELHQRRRRHRQRPARDPDLADGPRGQYRAGHAQPEERQRRGKPPHPGPFPAEQPGLIRDEKKPEPEAPVFLCGQGGGHCSRLRSIQAFFSCTSRRWVSRSAVGWSLAASAFSKAARAVLATDSFAVTSKRTISRASGTDSGSEIDDSLLNSR
jgi:tetratricopeptide (TPR) repeat protein